MRLMLRYSVTVKCVLSRLKKSKIDHNAVESGDFNVLAFPEINIKSDQSASRFSMAFVAHRAYSRYLWNHLVMNAAIQIMG